MKRYQTALKGMDLERLEAELTSIYEAEYLDHSERRIKIIAIEQEVVVRKKEAIANKTTIIL